MIKRNQNKTGLIKPHTPTRPIYLLPLLLLLGACQTTHPYKMELEQGNFLTADKVFHLKPGMTKAQVASVLGTPLLAEHVQSPQWEYTYTARQDGQASVHSNLELYFNGDILARFDGQLQPGPGQLAATTHILPKSHRQPHRTSHPHHKTSKTRHHHQIPS